jgi:hypothetical protein
VVKIKYAFMAASYKKKNAMLVFLFLIIGTGLLSISGQTIMTNAQRSSDSTSDGTSGSDTRVTQMGICVIGVASHCNGVK